ncbi:ureidoglycolate hydrolase [Hypoxylon sp. NC1633]|nr:ureidoglycolate hydrolase [Hypoxylon sp. NC1633]
MVLVKTLPIHTSLTLPAEPLTPSSFAPFGAVLANPAPRIRPQDAASAPTLPSGGVLANQGTAIQYRALAPPLQNLYAQAPSRKAATPRTTMFVCGARQLLPAPSPPHSSPAFVSISTSTFTPPPAPTDSVSDGLFQLDILERHPFTTQTFIPLNANANAGAAASTRYLVVVAPTLPPAAESTTNASNPTNAALPAPSGTSLPGNGMPDLAQVRAFVATGAQAVTYGAGTWHAPMAALGASGSAVDFVVVQFANDVPVEDCQEVGLLGTQVGGGDETGRGRILVEVPRAAELAKL